MELYNYAAQLFAAHHTVQVKLDQMNYSGTCFVSLYNKDLPAGNNMILDILFREDGSIESWSPATRRYVARANVASVKRTLRRIHQEYR